MLRQEAEWLARQLARHSNAALGTVANIGSSTALFRTVEQPWIEEILFAPLRQRAIPVVHIDLKPAAGVDLCVDILEDAGCAAVKALSPRTALLCNLLEHVGNPARLAQRAFDVLAPGGRLFVTVPRSYPRHRDPIDTMFRPTPDEVAALIPAAVPEASIILAAGSYWHDIWRNPGKIRGRRLAWLFRPYRVTCVALRKSDSTETMFALNHSQ